MCPLAFAPVPPLAASTYVSSSRPSPPYTSSDALPAVAFAPFQQPADSPLRASGRACLATGATALFRAEEAQAPHPDADAQALLDAAERSGIGVHVRPTKGAACVFWTMGKEGVDPSSQTSDLGSPAQVEMARYSVQSVGKPPEDLCPRIAFEELQGATDYEPWEQRWTLPMDTKKTSYDGMRRAVGGRPDGTAGGEQRR